MHPRKNVANTTPEVFLVKRVWDLPTFKKKAGLKMNLKVKRVFLANGSEVTGCDEMSANEILYISSGEDFYKQLNFQNNTANLATLSSSSIVQSNNLNSTTETFNVSVLGTGGVGKSAITLRFVRDTFIKDWDPTIEDAYKKAVTVDGYSCILDVLDTAGQDDFESLRASWMIGKHGYVFVFSLDQPESITELQPFIDLHYQLNEGRTLPIVLCGNKKDLILTGGEGAAERQAKSREMGKAKALELKARYIETSAATGDNVQEVFEGFVKQMRQMSPQVTEQVSKPKRCVLM